MCEMVKMCSNCISLRDVSVFSQYLANETQNRLSLQEQLTVDLSFDLFECRRKIFPIGNNDFHSFYLPETEGVSVVSERRESRSHVARNDIICFICSTE